MSVVSLFSASHCQGAEVARRVCDELGLSLLSNDKLLKETSERFNLPEEKLARAMHGAVSVFNRLTHDKERGVAYIRATLAELIQLDKIVYHGFAGHLLPKELSHVLRVCLVAKADHRAKLAADALGITDKEARKQLAKDDEDRKRWTLYLFGLSPWDKSLYDVIVPIDTMSIDEAVAAITEQAVKPALKTTKAAQGAAADFLLAAQVQLTLVEKGHLADMDVSVKGGVVTLTINRFVYRLEHLEEQLREIVSKVEGVKEVQTRVGPHFRAPSRFEKMVQESSPKILLVDDERDFVLTLSERLETRNLESAIAYDGEEALSILETDAPDVMVLDLKMPGIDGMVVLRRVKQKSPDTEVIILTGHGSDQEKRLAMELGAFAYLNKPVNIDVLAETMKSAYDKVRAALEAKERGDKKES